MVEAHDNGQYLVRTHGSGQTTLRNRRFLHRCLPVYADAKPGIGSPPTIELPAPRTSSQYDLDSSDTLTDITVDADDKASGLVDPIDGALDQHNTEVVEKPTSGLRLRQTSSALQRPLNPSHSQLPLNLPSSPRVRVVEQDSVV